ncbi:MAG TPA: hypothetical protein VF420_04585 [Casimicrobiaceae bacterium]
MSIPRRYRFLLVLLATLESAIAGAAAPEGESAAWSGSVTGFYYAMRDQSDFGVGVAALNRGSLHLEGRYNYEARDAGSAFVGWNFSGGEALTFAITPIIGALFGSTHGVIPGLEASVAYGPFDAYIEAEYVYDSHDQTNNYYYAWSELGWKPVEWLRLGVAGQRTRVVQTDRDLQRGLFAQLMFGKGTLSVYAFNPDTGSRYTIIALGIQF